MLKRHSNRKFNFTSYKDNDAKAKDTLKRYLVRKGHQITAEKEDYNYDLVSTGTNGDVCFWEVEIKNQWGKIWNPTWTEIRIPQRKQRLIDKFKQEFDKSKKKVDFTFVILNRHLDRGWFITADKVDKSEVGTIQNSRHVDAPHLKEPFFHIPLQDAYLMLLEED